MFYNTCAYRKHVMSMLLSVTYNTLLEFRALACQTKAMVPPFVLFIKYAPVCDPVTCLACRVTAPMPACSHFPMEGHQLGQIAISRPVVLKDDRDLIHLF